MWRRIKNQAEQEGQEKEKTLIVFDSQKYKHYFGLISFNSNNIICFYILGCSLGTIYSQLLFYPFL